MTLHPHPGEQPPTYGAGRVIAVSAADALTAVDHARHLAPDATVFAPAGASWTADELERLSATTRLAGSGDRVVCSLGWLRPDLLPRLLKPLEESDGRWLLALADDQHLSDAVRSRIDQHVACPDGAASLLDALALRGEQLNAGQRSALDTLRRLRADTTTPSLCAQRAAAACDTLATAELVRLGGGKTALVAGVIDQIEQQIRSHIAHHPSRYGSSWTPAHQAAATITRAREALAWQAPLWPLLCVILSAARAATTPGAGTAQLP
jgi:hypothetical protein